MFGFVNNKEKKMFVRGENFFRSQVMQQKIVNLIYPAGVFRSLW